MTLDQRIETLLKTDIGCSECGDVAADELRTNLKQAFERGDLFFDKQKVDGNTSDGYHTFNELYDHRVLLWINLCLLDPKGCYLVEDHYEGWFLLGKETSYGQISYHCPNKYLDLVKSIERRHPEFDGHSSNAVIVRLEHIARFGQEQSHS